MSMRRNEFGQPVGEALPAWSARAAPPRSAIAGRTCRIEPLEVRHADALFEAYAAARDPRDFTYLSVDPFASREACRAWVEKSARSEDPLFHAVVEPASGAAIGVAAFLRIDRANGVIEIGHLNFSPRLQRTTAATEAIFLLLHRAFDELGYRRCEWKCDTLNAPSRAAAERFGFRFEGVFHQAIVYKGRNRDTAWYAIVDGEWPALRAAFERWLAPANFDAAGAQRERLADLIDRERAG